VGNETWHRSEIVEADNPCSSSRASMRATMAKGSC
jgi:hypothetical protein